MAFGPRIQKLKDVDQTRAQAESLINLHGAQAESMLASAEKTRYQTGELERTEGLRTETKEFELEAAKLQKDKFAIMLNEFKASEPGRRALDNLNITKHKTEELQVQALHDFIKANPQESLTFVAREIEQATYEKSARAIHTRDMTMYKLGDSIVELMNQGRMTEANQMYEVAKQQYFEIEGKPLVDELGLPEQLNSDHISLLKGHVESAKSGTKWAELALQREKDAATLERVHAKGAYDIEAAKKYGADAAAQQGLQEDVRKELDAASDSMFRFISPHLTETMGAKEGTDNQFLPGSKNYGMSRSYHETATSLLQDAIKANATNPAFNSETAATNIANMMREDWVAKEEGASFATGLLTSIPGLGEDFDIIMPSKAMGQDVFLEALNVEVGAMIKDGIDPQIAIDTFTAQRMAKYRDFKRSQLPQAFHKAIK